MGNLFGKILSILRQLPSSISNLIKENMSDNMVTTSTTRYNKNYYKSEDNILLCINNIKVMSDKLDLYGDAINYSEEIGMICDDYIVNYDIEYDYDEGREPVPCLAEMKDIPYNKMAYYLNNKDYYNLEIFLDSDKQNQLHDISSIDKNITYKVAYISIFDVFDCSDSAERMSGLYKDELNYTLQNIYKFNDNIQQMDEYTLKSLKENTRNLPNILRNYWNKTRFNNNLGDLVENKIQDRVNALDENDNREKAFKSNEKILFDLPLIDDKQFLNEYTKKIKGTYKIDKDNNMVKIEIPVRRLRETLSLIQQEADEIAQKVIDLLEPIGMYINK